MDNNTLAHHGVKGQKWGVRRTPEQLGHRTKKSNKTPDQMKKEEMKRASKNRRLLSDADLKKRIERIKLEQQLKNLTNEEIRPGKKFISDVVYQSGKGAAGKVLTGTALYIGKVALTKNFDVREAAGYIFPKPKNK